MPSGDTARAWRVAWLERDYDKPGRFEPPVGANIRGVFQIKDDHPVGRCGWCRYETARESLTKTIKLFAEVTRS